MGYVLTERQSFDFVSALFQALGLDAAQAAIVADHLTQAEMRCLASHGLSRVPIYARRLQRGGCKLNPDIRVICEKGASALVDGDDAMGAVSASFAMRLAIDKARTAGSATVALKNANHIGFLAYYTQMAAREGMLGMAICNSGASSAVWGTRERVLGTNPLSIALPTGGEPIAFDAATSVVAQGKVAVAALEGRPIPDTWAYDPEGHPTTVAADALRGTMRPAGDYKGSGIAMMISLISAGLTGMPFDMEEETFARIADEARGSAIGAFFVAVDIGAFLDVQAFEARADVFSHQVKRFPCAPGFDEILLPGEIEQRATARARAQGFTIGDQLREVLRTLGQSHGLGGQVDSWALDNQ